MIWTPVISLTSRPRPLPLPCSVLAILAFMLFLKHTKATSVMLLTWCSSRLEDTLPHDCQVNPSTPWCPDNLPLSWGGSALALPTCLTLPYFSFPNLSRVLSLSSQVFTYLLCSLSEQYNPSKLRLPDLSYKNTGNPVKFEGQMNNKYSLGLSMSPAIFGTRHMYMYLLFTWNDIHSLFLVWQPPTPTHKETHRGTKRFSRKSGFVCVFLWYIFSFQPVLIS